MSKEKVRFRCQNAQIKELLRIRHFSLQIKRAKLRDEKFQVISKRTCEVRVYPALFQIFNSSPLMCVQSHQVNNDSQSLVFVLLVFLQVQPLRKPGDKRLLGVDLTLLAAQEAAKRVVAAAAESPRAGGPVLLLGGHHVIEQVLPGLLVLLLFACVVFLLHALGLGHRHSLLGQGAWPALQVLGFQILFILAVLILHICSVFKIGGDKAQG